MKHFNPNHYGYPSLKQAHKTMAKIADHINKVKKREENEKRVKHLQTSLYGWKGNDVRREGEREGERERERGTERGRERRRETERGRNGERDGEGGRERLYNVH